MKKTPIYILSKKHGLRYGMVKFIANKVLTWEKNEKKTIEQITNEIERGLLQMGLIEKE